MFVAHGYGLFKCLSTESLFSEHVWIIWWLRPLRSLELGERTYICCLKATLDFKHLFLRLNFTGEILLAFEYCFFALHARARLSQVYGSKCLQAKDYALGY